MRMVTKRGEPLRFLQEVVLTYESDTCLTWPFGKGGDGHGMISLDGRRRLVNRLVCKIYHGAPPSQRHQAAHNCGFSSCVNYRHLRWATPAENTADKILHGTVQR